MKTKPLARDEDKKKGQLISELSEQRKQIDGFETLEIEHKKAEDELRTSEIRFKELFKYMSSGVAVLEAVEDGSDFIFKDFNRAAERINQIKKEEVLGRKVTEMFPGIKEFGLFEVFQRVWRMGEPELHPVSLYKDPRIVDWRETSVYKLPSGEIVAVHDDLTEKKWAEEALEKSHELLETILANMPIGIALISTDKKIRRVNRAFVEMIGAEDEKEIIGNVCHQYICPAQEGACPFLDLGQSAANYEEVLLTKDGREITVIKNAIQIDLEGEEGLLETFIDITKRKRAEQAKIELKTQLLQSEKLASVGQLAAGVAHEINTPTGFVSSNLKMLSDYQNDISRLIKEYRKCLTDLKNTVPAGQGLASFSEQMERILKIEADVDIDFILNDAHELIHESREGSERIKKIVIDLLDFARPGADKVQDTDINKGLESTLNVLWNELKNKATVTKEYGDLPFVRGYPQQLNQVFLNILVNAAQAIDEHGDINISARAVDGYVEIKINDTGMGIPKEDLSKIFDPFFTTKDVGKGTGLGLNVSYNIIKKHNGTLNVQSEVGKGTTFTIKIPVKSDIKD